jgi:tetratricopeptide (TPR) repeat protein
MLSAGSVDLPERHRTIQGAISWSHDLLSEPGKRLFSRFSVFSGGARLEEIETVCGPSQELGEDLLDCLSTLVDHSLIRRIDVDGLPRFRMLHVIREYAAERLEEAGEAGELGRRHAITYTHLVETSAPELLRKDRKQWLDLLEHDHDNLRSALEWSIAAGETDLALRLAASSWRFWQARGHLHEARRRIEEVLSLDGGELRYRAKAMEALGGILWWQSEMTKVLDLYEQTLAFQRELGDPKEVANALYNYSLAIIFAEAADHETSSSALAESEELYTGLGDAGGLGDVEWSRGNYVAHVVGDLPRAIDHMKKSTDFYRQAGNEFGMGWGLFEVGEMARRQGDLDEAWSFASRGLALFAGHRDISGVVLSIATAAGIALDLGDIERAYKLAGAFHGLRITSGVDIVQASLNQIDGLEFESLEALTGEAAIAYREGRAMTFDNAVAYALAGPIDG